ncbi:MAG: sigma-70 family RNA polymerase sigma factor [Cytophagales bacterium]|nr:sigma-70 family RNA polymerase sigma factor [Cytophagales bacterium]
MTESQQVWIQEARKGNELAAYNLYESYSKAMYNTLIRMVRDEEGAKDLLQEAFIKAFKNLGNLTNDLAFAGWLKQIVVNTGLEYARKKKYVFEDIDEQHDDFEEDEPISDVDVGSIHAAVKELPDGCRTVLSLYIFEGYKHSEIAEELGITESTSKTQYRHAKKLLKEKLTNVYEGY